MGIPILIMGESGSGKSASLRNFEPGELGIFNVAGKPLPFRKRLPKVDWPGYAAIRSGMKKSRAKTFVIDDSQYLMAFEEIDRAQEAGYTKFTEMAQKFSGLVRYCITELPPDVLVYFLHHTETTDAGRVKAKTVGKMIDSKLTLEGLFSIVLLCEASVDGHYFVTQSDGYTTAKSPMGMFPDKIENDLKLVDATIRKYYFEEDAADAQN